jgi:FRG domain
MKGQWIGGYTGSNQGLVIVNIDERSTFFEGIAFLNESNGQLPSTAAFFRTTNKSKKFSFRADLLPINPHTALPDTWEKVRSMYSEQVNFPQYADVKGTETDQLLNLSWTTNIGTSGQCSLPKTKAVQPSECVAINKNWTGFKQYISKIENRRFLFRGQSKPWRLRTSFHRTGRANSLRFLNEDMPILHKHLSAKTRHVFNLQIPDEFGAFLNLVQHHGYPTPLLDWTYSPYVAAFFAYRGISETEAAKAGADEKVRILILDQQQWRADFNQVQRLIVPAPHVSICEFLAIENDRMIPQQAATMVTSIDDIETYIQSRETQGRKYLSAIDAPVRERKKVIEELSYMGITAGSLFPGLDGACEELRERNF